ncbi:MAG TPA: MaoC family dehydratase [Burkholderiaceae bacterium]|jgi:acyl dehydratase|nr:MaoC family dehydratase [Burkholderiaceae bacterium]
MRFRYYWEDFTPGWTFENGPRSLDRDQIVAFARDWDPQRYHVDEQAAKETPFGGLIASGWQTCGLMMRMMCDGYLLDSACIGSPGLDEVRWLKPVRPGDALTYRATVLEQTPSQKDPNRGSVTFRWELVDRAGEPVVRIIGRQYYLRREPAR